MSHHVRRVFLIVLFVIVLVLSLVFFLKNNEVITFNYIVGSTDITVSALLLLTFAAGAILGVISLLPLLLRLKHQQALLQKQIRMTEKEVENLRVLPVRD
ncbi:MAG TPA: LapA family protein [Gammaproteobacteria bacterium]|nr:LapA family protein [Gammaproteobacteria bacterium]